MTTINGSCHCGAVRFSVDVDFSHTEILDCNCSICRRKGFLHLIIEPARFALKSGRENLQEYRFNTGRAVHKFCSVCGIHPFYTPRSHPDSVDVNVRCLEIDDLSVLNIVEFDGQNWETNVDSIR